MVVGEYWWLIYLVFLAIPISRILPRIISRNKQSNRYYDNNPYENNNNNKNTYDTIPTTKSDNIVPNDDMNKEQKHKQSKPTRTHSSNEPNADAVIGQTDEMVVLGTIHRGVKTFDRIQKRQVLRIND